jgi:hypothetical protein
MQNLVTLTGFYSATGGSGRTITVDIDAGTAVEIKAQRRTGRKYASKVTEPKRLAKLIYQAKKKAGV